jgi:hypothetical protein
VNLLELVKFGETRLWEVSGGGVKESGGAVSERMWSEGGIGWEDWIW